MKRNKSRAPVAVQIALSVIAVLLIKNIAAGLTGTADQSAENIHNTGIYGPSDLDGTVSVDLTQERKDIFLELVNSDYAVHDASIGYVSVPAYGIVPVSNTGIELNPTALSALEEMLGDAKANGFDGFYLADGMRTYEQQVTLYEESAGLTVQKPNHSEHHTGLAADISSSDGGMKKEGKWLHENAHKYGYILRYPEDKTDITGIKYESWHFRYIGQPHAYYCYEHNLCLEEYILLLKESGGYSAEIDGRRYNVYYTAGSERTAFIPEDMDFTLSDDNTGGIIITCTGRS